MKKAIYPGSFDPPTFGHLDVLTQGVDLFGRENVCILIASNPNKKALFTSEERVAIWREIIPTVNVQVLPSGWLTASYAEEFGYTHMIRGLRGLTDLEEEMIMYDINAEIALVDTVYFMTTPKSRPVSSSVVKSLVGHCGGSHVLEKLVPSASLNALAKKELLKMEQSWQKQQS